MAQKATLPGPHSSMAVFRLAAFFFMAIQAEGVSPAFRQRRIFRGVGVMAWQACTFPKRLMLLLPLFQLRLIMTLVTESAPRFPGSERFFRFGGVMAISAASLDDRFVGARF